LSKKINLIGLTFNYLKVICNAGCIKNRSYSECLCRCGKIVIVQNKRIKSGHTKSCGCIKGLNQRKYSSEISSARKVWADYNKDLPFDIFYKLTQQNCFYCNSPPFNKINTSKKRTDSVAFVYSGLDRLNPSLNHNENNIVPCCKTCNFLKGDRNTDDFNICISRLKQLSWVSTEECRELSKKIDADCLDIKTNFYFSIKKIFTERYSDGDLTIKQFFQLSQMNCYYCDSEKLNYYSSYKSDKTVSEKRKSTSYFRYNGLDRIDNNLPHNFDNCIPCCRFCNVSKNNNKFVWFMIQLNNIKINNVEIK